MDSVSSKLKELGFGSSAISLQFIKQLRGHSLQRRYPNFQKLMETLVGVSSQPGASTAQMMLLATLKTILNTTDFLYNYKHHDLTFSTERIFH
jgi:hypothetical protein